MVCAIHQPHYLPWPRYLDKLARADVFVLLDDAQYSRNGWQNRNRLKGPQGAFLLTVPVRHRLGAAILGVEIADDRWRRAHRQALRTSYGACPGFSRLVAAVDEVLDRPWRNLAELNQELLGALVGLLGIRTPCLRSSDLAVGGTASERLARICRAVGASAYLSGAHATRAYLDPQAFERHGIELLVHHWQPPVYRQAHPRAGFVPELSIADLVAAEPERAAAILAGAGRVERAAPAGGVPAT